MKKLIVSLAVLIPSVAFAAAPVYDATSLSIKLNQIGNTVIGLLIAFAVIWIVISAVRFIMASGEERAAHRSSILWGLVGLAVILSIWGLVAILRNTFNTQNQTPAQDFPINTYQPIVQ